MSASAIYLTNLEERVSRLDRFKADIRRPVIGSKGAKLFTKGVSSIGGVLGAGLARHATKGKIDEDFGQLNKQWYSRPAKGVGVLLGTLAGMGGGQKGFEFLAKQGLSLADFVQRIAVSRNEKLRVCGKLFDPESRIECEMKLLQLVVDDYRELIKRAEPAQKRQLLKQINKDTRQLHNLKNKLKRMG